MEPMSDPVRRRGVLGMSGWMLFVCLFLPTLRVCDDPMMPIQFPPTYGVYIGGVIVAVMAFSTLRARRRVGFLALLTLYLTTLFTYAAIWFGAMTDEIAGVMAGAVFLVLLYFIVRSAAKVSWTERAVAIGCFVHGVVCTGWSALLAFDPNGMWGAQVSLAVSSVMLFAAGGFLVQELKAPSTPPTGPPLPAARMV